VVQSSGIMTTSEVADFLRVHPNTVRHWTNKGLLPSFRLGTRRDRRFRREDVDHFLQENNLAMA
jgi:excisionase family DNA binding protein